jgi:hypothetical protein
MSASLSIMLMTRGEFDVREALLECIYDAFADQGGDDPNAAEADLPLQSLAVCSDLNIGKRRVKNGDDSPELTIHDLAFPTTTN